MYRPTHRQLSLVPSPLFVRTHLPEHKEQSHIRGTEPVTAAAGDGAARMPAAAKTSVAMNNAGSFILSRAVWLFMAASGLPIPV